MRRTELLTEAQNYEGMFNRVIDPIEDWETAEHRKKGIQQDIVWARTVLKRLDRITWYLRLRRIFWASQTLQDTFAPDDSSDDENWKPGFEVYARQINRWVADAGVRGSRMFEFARRTDPSGDWYIPLSLHFGPLTRELEHLMGLPCESIQNFRFDRQTPESLVAKLKEMEAEWQQRGAQEIDPEGEVLIDFNNGWAWYRLDRASCDKEADAMGHCGNQFGVKTDRLLSLRYRQKNGMDRPSLTFILDQEGYLGEMKGRANHKPDAKYHPYIVTLLRHSGIKGLKGGGYDPENNFHINDLTPEEREAVYRDKPEMMTCSDYLKKFGPDKVLAVKMSKAITAIDENEDNHPTGLIEIDGNYIFALSSFADWVGAMRIYGDESIDEVLEADVTEYLGMDGNDQRLSSFVSGFPGAAEEKIMAYINETSLAVSKKFGDDWLEDYDWESVLDWIQSNRIRELSDLEDVLEDAYRHGYEVGTNKSIMSSLKNDAERGFGKFQLDTTPREDGRYYLWCQPAHWCTLLDNPYSSIHAETNLDLGVEGETLWDSKPSLADITGYIEEDSTAAYQYFIENCPEECRPDIPSLRPVEEMTLDEITAELVSLKDEEWVERYYGGSFVNKRPNGLKRERERRYGVTEYDPTKLTEAHHQLDNRNSTTLAPIKRGDTVRVFHGFRESTEALRTAKLGISGAARTGRVYSYEADNNPRGLFVTLSREVAARFVGAYGTRTIMEFVARTEDLEAPVWPNGRYTVQGEYATYFGHGHEGRRNRLAARKAQAADLAGSGQDDRIAASDDPMLASTLMHNSELQALFIGHLSPKDIAAFWVEGERDHWVAYSVKEYIAKFGDGYPEQDVMKGHSSKVFTAGEEFDGNKWLAAMTDMGGVDIEKTLANLWGYVLRAPVKDRVRRFLADFGMFLYPKQTIPAMRWMRDRYGRR